MAEANAEDVRVRFAPSPTGYLHIGGARTALFNWLLARQAKGTFVLRIEDTDQTRHVEDSARKIIDDLRWLGLQWDEGPDCGGEAGPYYQSRRLSFYTEHLRRLLESGCAYYALETPEELELIRQRARAERRPVHYTRPDPMPTIDQGLAAREAGRPVVVRFKTPGEPITVVDAILGEVTVAADQLEDFVIQKSDGFPTYHFACVVDDALMRISHVLRGQEHLMNTPKHVALQRALGFPTPVYAHLPVIFNMDGSKMSKRDKEKAAVEGLPAPEVEVRDFREAGYLPEAVVNFISLLGWSAGEDRERFSLEEMVALFRVERIGKTNARFDREKLLSFNTDWAAKLPPERLLSAFKDFLAVNSHLASAMREADDATLVDVLRVCHGFRTFADIEKKAGFLFVADDAITYDPRAVNKVLSKNEGEGYAMLADLLPRLGELPDWSSSALEAFFHGVCDEKNIKLGKVAQPVRVAVTGTTISPSIHDTLVLLGKERTIARLRRCLAQRS
ncbi:MAG: glutamate--tRNA ligase [Phycisphaerae bacterium]